MGSAVRTGICGLLTLCALAAPATGAAAGLPAHASVGFEPIPLSVAADASGHVYLSSPLGSTTVYQYSSDGQLLADIGAFAASSNPFAPRDIATDPAGNLYVDDAPGQTVSVLGPDGSPLRHWDGIQSGRDLAVGTDGSVFVAGPGEIQRYSAEGAPLNKWDGAAVRGGRFGEVWGLDTSPSGLVYVADTYGNRIDVFTPDGVLVREWGQYGRARGHFVTPYGIAVNAAEEVYVADTVNDRVERFTATGLLLNQWGGPGRSHGRFYTPTSITTDPAGYVYVADNAEAYPAEGLARIQKFTADGKFVTQWYDNPGYVPPGRPRLRGNVGRRTAKRSATFRFHSRAEGVRYECRLSGKAVPRKLREWRPCSSPKRYTRLRPGPKVFHVRADRGSVPGREATRSWLITA
jgi:DNA-binding beta-propeller fold protein YncE